MTTSRYFCKLHLTTLPLVSPRSPYFLCPNFGLKQLSSLALSVRYHHISSIWLYSVSSLASQSLLPASEVWSAAMMRRCEWIYFYINWCEDNQLPEQSGSRVQPVAEWLSPTPHISADRDTRGGSAAAWEREDGEADTTLRGAGNEEV